MKDLYTETTKYCWKKLKEMSINGNTSYIDGLEDLLLWIVDTTESDLQIQCNPYHNANDIFFFAEIEKPKNHISQGTWEAKTIMKNKKEFPKLITK